MAIDKELEKEVTDFVNKALRDDFAFDSPSVPIPNPKPKRHVGFKIKSWRWVDEPNQKSRGER